MGKMGDGRDGPMVQSRSIDDTCKTSMVPVGS